MTAGPQTAAWTALTADPRWTPADGSRPGWARALVPARDSPRSWVWTHLALVVPTVGQVAVAPAGDTALDRGAAVLVGGVLLVLTVRRGALALRRP